MFYLYLFFLAFFDIAGIMFAKYWNLRHSPVYLLCAIVSYMAVAIFLSLTLRYEGAAVVNALWVGITAILGTTIGLFYFHEIVSVTQLMGIGIIIFGLILTQIK